MRYAALLLSVVALACSHQDSPAGADPGASASAAPTGAPSSAAVSGESVYVLEAKLIDQDGATVPLDAYRGHPVLVAMFYGSCPVACPTLTSDIKNIEARLSPEQRANVRVLMISFDPQRDTPDALKQLVTKHKVDAERWKFATSSEGSVREIAAVLGVQYRKMGDGEFSHTTAITLLDRDGVTAARIEGLHQPSDDLVSKLRTLTSTK